MKAGGASYEVIGHEDNVTRRQRVWL